MRFRSTRSEAPPVLPAQALVAGLAPDGGLYVPISIPGIDRLAQTQGQEGYPDLLAGLLCLWFPDFAKEEVEAAARRAAGLFDCPEVAPLVRAEDLQVLELFHGPTLAFKDLALTVFGDLVAMARSSLGLEEELLVVVATSGDTGSAALGGLAGRRGIKVVVLYPARGISEIQRLQMTTHEEPNCLVLGIEGNFDDAQRMAKTLLGDSRRRRHFAELSLLPCSANSINVGRLVPQIAYYIHAWRSLAGGTGGGPSLDLAIPSGNFGNALAASYAKAMGLPLGRTLVATNANRVLADFFATGTYDRRREFRHSLSPSMDILVSSNLERLVFEASGGDAARVSRLMSELASEGCYRLSSAERSHFRDFHAASVDDARTLAEIDTRFRETGYLLDPHSATASAALRAAGGRNPAILVATASPFKFPATVSRALGLPERKDEFECMLALAEAVGQEPPASLLGLREAREVQDQVVGLEEVEGRIFAWLGGGESA